jgi:hypothetical protein
MPSSEENTEGEEDKYVESGRGYGLGAATFRRLNTTSNEEDEEVESVRGWGLGKDPSMASAEDRRGVKSRRSQRVPRSRRPAF